jgi:3-oxoacyl-[acyl-carrier protein] reductase
MKNFVIITGASRGIGKETAKLFLDSDWSVINLSRSPCDLPNIINIPVDLSVPNWADAIEPFLLKSIINPGKISLVHNAALAKNDSICDVPQEAFQKVLAVNVLAPVKLNQMLLPLMLPGSSIVYIGSTLSEKAIKNAASYVVTKHALVGLMRSTCQDLVGTGIHTVCICPGFTDTEMLREHFYHDQNLIEAAQNRVSAKRLIRPVEIAEFVWFCANHEVINGSVLHAHLGQIEG